MELKMGIQVPPPPYDKGTDCSYCTPSLWPPGSTPKYVYACFSDIINCGKSSYDAPNGYTFRLEQSPGAACTWLHDGVVWQVDWEPKVVGHDYSRVRLFDILGYSFFSGIGDVCADEIIRYVNSQGSCILMYAGAGGFCCIDWSGILLAFIIDLGIDAYHQLMRDGFYVNDESFVYRLASIYQRTNIKIKCDL